MSVYLIDYENVHYAGLKGIDKLTPADEVIMFYGNSASTIPMELHIDIAKSGAKVQYLKIERTGKNYLDFQLAAMTGYMVGTTKQTEYIIISKDTGFESVLDLWNGDNIAGKKLSFLRREQIQLKPVEKKAKKKTGKNANKSTEQKKSEAKPEVKNHTAIPETPQSDVVKPEVENREMNQPVIAKQESSSTTRALPKITEAQKKAIRNSVKDLGLKPSDYTKVYRAFVNQKDKQNYNIQLVKQLKQETGNAVYKNTVKLFEGAHEA